MMNILAHRGLWIAPKESNTLSALHDAITNGFGIETDIREYNGRLILSHDIGDISSPVCEDFFADYHDVSADVPLALNVKEDGIQTAVGELLEKYKIHNYYFFDMSIPEMVVYNRMKMAFYTRHSDIERECVMYGQATGVWVDAFFESWDMIDAIQKHLKDKKAVTLISPEIHGKDNKTIWEQIKVAGISGNAKFSLCTDQPMEARKFFD